MTVDEERLRAYISDAASHFKSPEDVLNHSELSAQEKRKILESWKVDAQELSTAAEENMGNDDPDMLEKVTAALRTLEH
jgi:hypothetical protein